MTKETSPSTTPPSRLERIFAFMSISIVGISLIAFIAIMIATATGMQRDEFANGVWPLVTVLPLIGLPIAFVLIIALTILNARRRVRDTKEQG